MNFHRTDQKKYFFEPSIPVRRGGTVHLSLSAQESGLPSKASGGRGRSSLKCRRKDCLTALFCGFAHCGWYRRFFSKRRYLQRNILCCLNFTTQSCDQRSAAARATGGETAHLSLSAQESGLPSKASGGRGAQFAQRPQKRLPYGSFLRFRSLRVVSPFFFKTAIFTAQHFMLLKFRNLELRPAFRRWTASGWHPVADIFFYFYAWLAASTRKKFCPRIFAISSSLNPRTTSPTVNSGQLIHAILPC